MNQKAEAEKEAKLKKKQQEKEEKERKEREKKEKEAQEKAAKEKAAKEKAAKAAAAAAAAGINGDYSKSHKYIYIIIIFFTWISGNDDLNDSKKSEKSGKGRVSMQPVH